MTDETGCCAKCGSAIRPAEEFCAKCGRSPATAGGSGREPAVELSSSDCLEWTIAFPLLTNRFFLYDMAKMLFWTFAIFDGMMLALFSFQRNMDAAVPFLSISGLILLGFVIVIVGITILVFGNRFPTRFVVNLDGVSYASRSGRAGTLNRAAIIIGLLARRPGAAGAGLLAVSQESGSILWEDIHRIREYPSLRVISLMNSWRVVVRVYCTPENYSRVAESVRSRAAAGALKRRERERHIAKKPSPVPRMALLSLLTLVACAGVLVSPLQFDPLLLLSVLACMLLTIWLPGLSRFSGALAIAGTVFLGFAILRLGTEVHELIPRSVLKGAPPPAWSHYTRFGSMEFPEWIRLGIAIAGLIVLGGLALLASLGRLHRRNPVSRA
jgi:hypothetical protein